MKEEKKRGGGAIFPSKTDHIKHLLSTENLFLSCTFPSILGLSVCHTFFSLPFFQCLFIKSIQPCQICRSRRVFGFGGKYI